MVASFAAGSPASLIIPRSRQKVVESSLTTMAYYSPASQFELRRHLPCRKLAVYWIMDPLSALAPAIRVARVVAQVNFASKVLHNGGAEHPGRLCALSDEVADIEFVLHQVALVLQRRNYYFDGDESPTQALLYPISMNLEDNRPILDRLADTWPRKQVLLKASGWRKWLPKLQALQVGSTKGQIEPHRAAWGFHII